ncbi:hypothetical protein GE09DRAFT_1092282 [Coniochaeta sp. 2T2.1]|nr:hypothetical protein GE09DRAFT_1092282 [Coniochaeta sp. 2T2.1]
MTALFGACLVLFTAGALVLRFSVCGAAADTADIEDGNTGVARSSTSVDDTTVQPPPRAGLPPVQIQPEVAPAPAPVVHEAQGSPLERDLQEHIRQDMIRMLHDINIEHEIPLPPRPTRTNPRQTPYAQRSEREAPAENSPPNRQVPGDRPSIINSSPNEGHSTLVPPRRHPGRLSSESRKPSIPPPISEDDETDSHDEGNQRYLMPQGPNNLWPSGRGDGTFSRAGNRPADETQGGQTSNAQRPPTPLVNPHDQNPSVNLVQLDHDHQDAQERMSLVLSLFDVKDREGSLHHLEAMARNLPRWSDSGATEVEQDNASDISDGSVYSASCGFSRWRKSRQSWATDPSEEEVERLTCLSAFEPSVYSDSSDYNYSEYSDSSNSRRATHITPPSSPCDSDHNGGVDIRFDGHNNNDNPRRQSNKDYHYACPSTAVANRLIDLLDRMFDWLDAKAQSDQAPGAMREEPSCV